MKKKELVKKLNKLKDMDVVIKVQGGFYLPIEEIKTEFGSIVIVCKDITKIGGNDDEEIS